jgi:xylulokinase
MNCALAVDLMCKPFGLASNRLDDVITRVPPGAEGLTVLPFFTGERTPYLPDARASVLGLDALNCGAAHVLRATVEGATFGLRFGLDEMRRLGLQTTEIVLTGGGARSTAWCQIVADVCELPVQLLACDEGAAFGAALQALWVLERAAGSAGDIRDLVREHVRVRPESTRAPEPAGVAAYHKSYSTYRQAVTRLTEQTSHSGVKP